VNCQALVGYVRITRDKAKVPWEEGTMRAVERIFPGKWGGRRIRTQQGDRSWNFKWGGVFIWRLNLAFELGRKNTETEKE